SFSDSELECFLAGRVYCSLASGVEPTPERTRAQRHGCGPRFRIDGSEHDPVVAYRRQGHGVTLSIQYRSTASSSEKSTSTFTAGAAPQLKCSRNSRSGAVSFSLMKTTSNRPPAMAAQADASTDTAAVHFRCRV